jgi:hypothetical protein
MEDAAAKTMNKKTFKKKVKFSFDKNSNNT